MCYADICPTQQPLLSQAPQEEAKLTLRMVNSFVSGQNWSFYISANPGKILCGQSDMNPYVLSSFTNEHEEYDQFYNYCIYVYIYIILYCTEITSFWHQEWKNQ